MKKLLSLLTVGLLPLCAYAQKPIPVDITSDCYLYGVDYSTIICRYDDNGARIFRGFECRTSHNGSRSEARTANATATNTAKDNAVQTELATIGKVTVSPNPTEGQITVAFENLPQKGAILYLTDVNARLLYEQEVVDAQTSLSLQILPPAVYTLVLVRKGNVLWKTQIVKI